MQLQEGICSCGKKHYAPVDEIVTGSGAIYKLPESIRKYDATKVFIIADVNTYAAAGEKACKIIADSNIEYSEYVFRQKNLEPDEGAVGSAIMHFDRECDLLIGVGSGVINDISKIVSCVFNIPYIIVATAPSMDGYSSATSSVALDGLKVSLNSKCANVIIGDTDILSAAPLNMLKAGIGDMLAKYISICEWRIANLVTGEYYCEHVAELIRKSVKRCVDNASLLLKRDSKAVEAVFDGLVSGGIAMAYAEVSRPASGMEHYFSHIWDMRGLEFNTKVDLHGIQCAAATYISVQLYEKLKNVIPDKEVALKYTSEFDFNKWSKELSDFLGNGATAMISMEEKDGKYDTEKHGKRFEVIRSKWNEIMKVIDEEIPQLNFIESLFKEVGLPFSAEEINIDKKILPMTFKATKDIRDKYILSRLVWDLGIIEEFAQTL